MGLSDEERQDKIIATASEIFKLAVSIEKNAKNDNGLYGTKESIERLCSEAKAIWHAIYGGHSNSAYWILGGSVGSETKNDAFDPLSSAIRHQLDDSAADSERSQIVDDYEEKNYHLGQMTHLYLTRDASVVLGELLQMYEYIESMFYAVRRYDDELRQSLSNLDALLSSLYGQFYCIFKYSQEVVHCYLIADICKLLIRNEKFEAALKSQHLQHNMRYMGRRNVSELVALHKELHEAFVQDKGGREYPDLNSCVQTFLKLAGRRFHCDYGFKALKGVLDKKGNKIDWATAESNFNQCKKLHAQEEKEGRVHYGENSDWNHMVAIHGYRYQKPENKTVSKKGAK